MHSIPTTTVLCQLAAEVARLCDRVVAEEGADPALARGLQVRLLHRAIHWLHGQGSHFAGAEWTLDRVERLARRVARRGAMLKPAPLRGPRPIPLGVFLKIWEQLDYLEQRVMRLLDLRYRVEDIGLVLGISPTAVEYYRSQAAGKIHRAFVGC
jgi:hypothetical protein